MWSIFYLFLVESVLWSLGAIIAYINFLLSIAGLPEGVFVGTGIRIVYSVQTIFRFIEHCRLFFRAIGSKERGQHARDTIVLFILSYVHFIAINPRRCST